MIKKVYEIDPLILNLTKTDFLVFSLFCRSFVDRTYFVSMIGDEAA
ncbi:MAG: hypothetical protein R6V00_05450 [Candidatus Aminicenantes bacterium]